MVVAWLHWPTDGLVAWIGSRNIPGKGLSDLSEEKLMPKVPCLPNGTGFRLDLLTVF